MTNPLEEEPTPEMISNAEAPNDTFEAVIEVLQEQGVEPCLARFLAAMIWNAAIDSAKGGE